MLAMPHKINKSIRIKVPIKTLQIKQKLFVVAAAAATQ